MKMLLVLSKDFVKVAATKDIEPSQMKAVEVGDENICVSLMLRENTMRLAMFARIKVAL
ncbi:MAG: hypothetical protein WAM42_01920 [Candidatus Nitrosopolaris sp.]|jgi:hypothetical protein